MVTISEWSYEDVANTAIHVGTTAKAVPLPSAHSLGLLRLGAAGLMTWRQPRKAAATADV